MKGLVLAKTFNEVIIIHTEDCLTDSISTHQQHNNRFNPGL